MTARFHLVAGLGQTGQSIARWLERRQLPYILFDTRPHLPELEQISAQLHPEHLYLERVPESLWPNIHTVICSPGISPHEAFLQAARERNIPVIGDIECLGREIKTPSIGITGTNGKSTVTSLVGEMARAAGFNTAVAGNIGTPVLDMLDDKHPYDLWVLELSSYQLELTSSLKLCASTILNISPDHLERHKTLEDYAAAKQRIYRQSDYILFNRDEAITAPVSDHPQTSTVASFALNTPPTAQDWGIIEHSGRTWLAHGTSPFMDVAQLKVKGRHYWLNALAASALARQVDIPMECIIEVLQTYPGLAHRTEWLRQLNGVDWVNDSKGTNIGATQAALEGIGPTIEGKIVLLAGGIGKGADYRALIPGVQAFVRCIITFGEDGPKIKQALETTVPCYEAKDLAMAAQLAQQYAHRGDTVLLSPACASFDMFRDFNHRGEVFRQLVNAL